MVARRVLAATGMVDELPEIDGVAEHWGGDVIHCPFCHGYEVRDQRVVQIVTHPAGLHPAALFRQLTAQLTIVLHDGRRRRSTPSSMPSARPASTSSTSGSGASSPATTGTSSPSSSATADRIDADAVVVGARFRVRAEPFASLGLATAPHPSGLGDVVEVDATGETSVPGLYAAGNVADPSQQVLQAAANGSRVGGMISFSLAHEDIAAAARPSGNETDWDHRYSGDQLWSGNPNGTLVRRSTGSRPGAPSTSAPARAATRSGSPSRAGW